MRKPYIPKLALICTVAIVFAASIAAAIHFAGARWFSERSRTADSQNARKYLLASDQYSQGDLEGAMKTLRGMRGIRGGHGKFAEPALLEGKIYYFRKDFIKAKNTFSRLIDRGKRSDAEIWYARSLSALGKNREAEEYLEACLERDPSDWRLLYQASVLAASMGNPEKRLDFLNKTSLVLEESARVFFDLAKIWHVLGEEGRTLENIGKVKAVAGKNGGVFGALESFERSLTAKDTQDNE